MKSSKKKAFTLVELLVVVLVLGVLAGVGVPKFKRMLETRKTGEAEAMLAAVRMEQEKRCIAGKEYRTALNKLDVLSTASGSKNYTYKLTSTGIVAEAKGKSKEADQYNLQLTSYKEGNICCAGAGCKKLNKNYPECKALVRDECSANVECTGEEPAHDKTETVGRCTLSYSQSVECDKDYGNWNASGFVLAGKVCTCEDPEVKQETEKCSRTRSDLGCDTSTGIRSYGDWSEWIGGETGFDEEETKDGKCVQEWKTTCQSDGSLGKELVGEKTCECTGKPPFISHKQNISHGMCLINDQYECDPSEGIWVKTDTRKNCSCDTGYTYNETTESCEETCSKTCSDNAVLDPNTCTCRCQCDPAERVRRGDWCAVHITEVSYGNSGSGRKEFIYPGKAVSDFTCEPETDSLCGWRGACEYSRNAWRSYYDGSVQSGCFENDSSFTGPGNHCPHEGDIMRVAYGGSIGENGVFNGIGCSGGSGNGGSNSSGGTVYWQAECTVEKYKCTKETKTNYVFKIGSGNWYTP